MMMFASNEGASRLPRLVLGELQRRLLLEDLPTTAWVTATRNPHHNPHHNPHKPLPGMFLRDSFVLAGIRFRTI